MSNINQKLKELSPHVLSIRVTKGISVIDTHFKDGWTLPNSKLIGVEAIPDKDNYYMLYPLEDSYGVDEMFDYVSYVIKVNIEREKKIELLQSKINELKSIFSKNSLEKCSRLKFSFPESMKISGGDSVSLSDMPLIDENVKEGVDSLKERDLEDEIIAEDISKPIDDEVSNFNNQTAKVNNEVFDLPIKKDGKIVVESYEEPELVCKCDPNNPNEVCPVCIDY